MGNYELCSGKRRSKEKTTGHDLTKNLTKVFTYYYFHLVLGVSPLSKNDRNVFRNHSLLTRVFYCELYLFHGQYSHI